MRNLMNKVHPLPKYFGGHPLSPDISVPKEVA